MRQLPHDDLQERCCLGACLSSVDAFGDARAILGDSGTKFYSMKNAAVYDALCALSNDNQPHEAVNVFSYLAEKGQLKSVGENYLADLLDTTPSVSQASWYAQKVEKVWQRRQLIGMLSDTLDACYTDAETEELANTVTNSVFTLQDKGHGSKPKLISDVNKELMAKVESRRNGEREALLLGWEEVDRKIGGLEEDDFMIIAARPAQGKSVAALNIAEHVARYSGDVLYFSLEMAAPNMAARMLAGALCHQEGITARSFKEARDLTDRQLFNIRQQMEHMEGLPVWLDSETRSLDGIISVSKRWHRRHNLRLVVIDYLQLIDCNANGDTERVGEISRRLRALAMALGCPVLALAQVNRGNTQRDDKRPKMSDLRNSGQIEQDATVIAMLHREDYYHSNDFDYTPTSEVEIILEKMRDGEIGTVSLPWDGAAARIYSREKHRQEIQYQDLQGNPC